MAYGWAILVIIAAIGAMAYFGVLNPERYRAPSDDPERLEVQQICQEIAATDYGLSDSDCTFSNHTLRCTCVGRQLVSPAYNVSHAYSDEYIPAIYNQTTKEFYARVP